MKSEIRPILSISILLQLVAHLKENESSPLKRNLLKTLEFGLENLLNIENTKTQQAFGENKK
jgi:hypothetical protein